MQDTLEALSPLAAELRAELLRIARAPLALALDEDDEPAPVYTAQQIEAAQHALDWNHADSDYWAEGEGSDFYEIIEQLGLKATRTPCKHDWVPCTDWEGDPSIYRGTHEFTFWKCLDCQEESCEQPPDWNEREYRKQCYYDRANRFDKMESGR